jgi:hypothetical protein
MLKFNVGRKEWYYTITYAGHWCPLQNPSVTCMFVTYNLLFCGSVVVKALCYKPEGRGYETR